MNVYIAIFSIGAPIIWVCIAGLAMQAMLGMTSEVLRGVDHTQARLMFNKHPRNLHATHDETGAAVNKKERALQLMVDGSFSDMQTSIAEEEEKQELAAADKKERERSPSPVEPPAAVRKEEARTCCQQLVDVLTLRYPRALASAILGGILKSLTEFLMPSFRLEIENARNSVLSMEADDFIATYALMQEDVRDASERVGLNVAAMMTLITQGLGGLAVFLIVISAMTFASGQRFVVIVLFLVAIGWVHFLCSITREARVYSFLVLAESTKYLNLVLWIDQCLDLEELHREHQASAAKAPGAPQQPPAPKTIAERLNALRWSSKAEVEGALKWPWVKEVKQEAKRAALTGAAASAPSEPEPQVERYTVQVVSEEEALELAAIHEAKQRAAKAGTTCSVQ